MEDIRWAALPARVSGEAYGGVKGFSEQPIPPEYFPLFVNHFRETEDSDCRSKVPLALQTLTVLWAEV